MLSEKRNVFDKTFIRRIKHILEAITNHQFVCRSILNDEKLLNTNVNDL